MNVASNGPGSLDKSGSYVVRMDGRIGYSAKS
jgi:hypothetical protein